MSTPAVSSKDLSYLATVLDVTALKGLMRTKNKSVSAPLVLDIYMCLIDIECHNRTYAGVMSERGEEEV